MRIREQQQNWQPAPQQRNHGPLAAIVPLLATAAGAAYSVESANATKDKMNQDVASQLQTQQNIAQNERNVVSQQTKQNTEPKAKAQIDEGAAKQLDAYHQLQALPLASASSPTPSNSVVDAETKAQTEGINQAAAKLAGYGSFENAQSLANQNAANALNILGSQSNLSSSTLPYQLGQDQLAGQTPQAIGSLISSAGELAGTANAVSPLVSALQTAAQTAKLKGQLQTPGPAMTGVPGGQADDATGAFSGFS